MRGAENDAVNKDAEELDQVTGNAEGKIGEHIAAMHKTELLYSSKSLLAFYGSLLVCICGQPNQFKVCPFCPSVVRVRELNPTKCLVLSCPVQITMLQAIATLWFSKFLCMSLSFCDANHHLLFCILETSKDANIQSNIVIALRDIMVSFSTIIDESSDDLSCSLKDASLVMKKNTLMVLTDIILNGMMKVKGQLGEMAICLEDDEPWARDLAECHGHSSLRLFLKLLSLDMIRWHMIVR